QNLLEAQEWNTFQSSIITLDKDDPLYRKTEAFIKNLEHVNPKKAYQKWKRYQKFETPKRKGWIYKLSIPLTETYAPEVLIYLPEGYKPKQQHKTLIYFKGGWMNRKTLPEKVYQEIITENPFFPYLDQENIIQVFPILDWDLAINWKYGYQHLEKILQSIKFRFNIDDNAVIVGGFSDGGLSANSLAIYKPNGLAGVISINGRINSQPPMVNFGLRPMLSFVGSADQVAHPEHLNSLRAILPAYYPNWEIQMIKGKGHNYLEYPTEVVPQALEFCKTTKRTSYPARLYYHRKGNYKDYDGVDWLQVSVRPDSLPNQEGEVPIVDQTISYQWANGDTIAYQYGPKYGQIQAQFQDNRFNLYVYRIDSVTLRLSPDMVDFKRPVEVWINGYKQFDGRVDYNSDYFKNQLITRMDRKQIWVDTLNVAVPPYK
ncbi:MAG: hypothetical protein AAFV80_10675, partial [Bacteroidota bacterium]